MTPTDMDPTIDQGAVSRLIADYADHTAQIPSGVQARVLAGLTQRIAAGELGPDLPPRDAAPGNAAWSGASTSSAGHSVIAAAQVSASLWRRVALILGLSGVAAIAWVRPWEQRPSTAEDGIALGSMTAEVEQELAAAGPPMASAGNADPSAGSKRALEVQRPAPTEPHAPSTLGAMPQLDDTTSPAEGNDRTRALGEGSAASARPAASKKRPIPHDDAADVDALAAELALVSKARLAIKSGRDAEALAALDQHAAEYPRGALESERDLSRVQVLCRIGDSKRAAVISAALRKRAAGSVWVHRLKDTCAGPAAAE